MSLQRILVTIPVALLSAHGVAHAQSSADTLALARGTAVAVASITSPPQLRADTVIIEPRARWDSMVVGELKPSLGDTSTGPDGPHWMRFGTHGLTIVGDSATVLVEVDICSRTVDWRDDQMRRFHGHGHLYVFRREWSGWELERVLPGWVGDGSCDPTIAPYEHGMIPRIEYVERDVEPRLLNRNEVQSLLDQLYPDSLRREGVGGRVLLWMRVSESGEVVEVRVHTSSGHDALDEAATEIAASMEFNPAENEGEPVSVWIAQPIHFGPLREDTGG